MTDLNSSSQWLDLSYRFNYYEIRQTIVCQSLLRVPEDLTKAVLILTGILGFPLSFLGNEFFTNSLPANLPAQSFNR